MRIPLIAILLVLFFIGLAYAHDPIAGPSASFSW